MSSPVDATRAVEAVWRAEAASMLGVLARRLGDLDRAEEALQEAVAEALKHWPADGLPAQPAGWLVTTAWRKALDRLRRDAAGQAKLAAVAAESVPEPTDDDRLALIFACCHPSVGQPAQVALTLSAVSGLATEEIAAAFLVPTATLAQRLVRAKRRLREAGVRFTAPEPDQLGARLPAVLAVVYLVFNEGYLAAGARLGRSGGSLPGRGWSSPGNWPSSCRASPRPPAWPPCSSCTRRVRPPASTAMGASCCSRTRTGRGGTASSSAGP